MARDCTPDRFSVSGLQPARPRSYGASRRQTMPRGSRTEREVGSVSAIATTWELRESDPAGRTARVNRPHVRMSVPNLFVVPAFNEIDNLPRLLEDLEGRPELFPPGSRLFVVD